MIQCTPSTFLPTGSHHADDGGGGIGLTSPALSRVPPTGLTGASDMYESLAATPHVPNNRGGASLPHFSLDTLLPLR